MCDRNEERFARTREKQEIRTDRGTAREREREEVNLYYRAKFEITLHTVAKSVFTDRVRISLLRPCTSPFQTVLFTHARAWF